MNLVHRMFFAHFCLHCLVMATGSTIDVFKDCGETVAVIMTCLFIQQILNLSLLLLSNLATQLLLANHPIKLNSETFENMIKLLIGVAVPVFSTLTSVVTVLYLDMKPPAGYYMKRGTTTEDKTLVIVQASIFILIFCAFWTSRIWIQKVQGHERSNHNLGSKAVALFCADLIAFFLACISNISVSNRTKLVVL